MITTPYKILVVDDQPEICELIKDILEDHYGDTVHIQTTDNVDRGVQIIQNEDIRLILCDFHLPGGDGDTLLRAAQQLRSGIRFIMLTGDVSFETVMASFLEGAVSIIEKPFKPEQLIASVNICIKRLQYWQGQFNKVR
jgi:DNA-binding NtrC family response regulator